MEKPSGFIKSYTDITLAPSFVDRIKLPFGTVFVDRVIAHGIIICDKIDYVIEGDELIFINDMTSYLEPGDHVVILHTISDLINTSLGKELF